MASSTFGLGGFGLLIAPVCPCRAMVTEDDELVIAHGEREVARLTPGDRPASGKPTWHTPKDAQFGEGGPTLSIADHLVYEDIFVQVDTGLGGSQWCALGPGFIHDLPPGLILLSASPEDDDDPCFELHLAGTQHEFIRFQTKPRPASSLQMRPAPHQQLLSQDHLSVREADGSIRKIGYTEVAYEHEGATWKKLMIAAPLRETTSVIVSAQARVEHADALFRAAGQVAATLGPLG